MEGRLIQGRKRGQFVPKHKFGITEENSKEIARRKPIARGKVVSPMKTSKIQPKSAHYNFRPRKKILKCVKTFKNICCGPVISDGIHSAPESAR